MKQPDNIDSTAWQQAVATISAAGLEIVKPPKRSWNTGSPPSAAWCLDQVRQRCPWMRFIAMDAGNGKDLVIVNIGITKQAESMDKAAQYALDVLTDIADVIRLTSEGIIKP